MRKTLFAACRVVLTFLALAPFLFAPAAHAAPMLPPENLPDAPGRGGGLAAVLKDISGRRADVIAIQRELVARPALNPEHGGEGEEAKANWVEDRLRDKGLPHALRIDCPDERVPSKVRPNLIIRYPGSSERTLWIIAHLDTSPSGSLSLWTGSPWALRVVGDEIYGRGVEDNHQAVTSGLILLESLARNRVTPPLSFGLVLTAGEKMGYPRRHGMEAVLQAKPDLFRPGDLIVVHDYGNTEGTVVEVAEKGLLWLKITVTGTQAFSARPDTGVNALDAGAAFITDLRGLHALFPVKNTLFSPPTSTFIPTAVLASDAQINQMPGEFAFHLDCRLLAPYTLDAVQQAVRTLADTAEKRDGVRITLDRISAIPVFPETSPGAPVVRALERAVRAHTGREVKIFGIGGVTLAADLRARDLPVAVWAMSDSMGAASNEHISISALLEASQVFARILFDPEALKNAQPATPVGASGTVKP